MPVFIKIIRQDENVSGVTSKASVIIRKGKTVLLQWGAIISKNRKFYWAGKNLPQSKAVVFKSIIEADAFKREKIMRRNNERYTKLQPGQRIYKNKTQ